MNSKDMGDMFTFEDGMASFDYSNESTYGWNAQATSPTGGGGTWMNSGATDHSYAFHQDEQDFLRDTNDLQELGNPIIDWATLVPDNAKDAPLGDTSGFDHAIDWTLFSAVDPLVDNSFLLNTGTVPQYNLALNPSALPGSVPSYTYPAIAPAATNLLAAPNSSSGAHVGAQHRVIDTRIRCTTPGCSKTFRRVGDCRRHMRKHQAPKLTCIVDGCDMKFTRLDKVRDHLRQGHKIIL